VNTLFSIRLKQLNELPIAEAYPRVLAQPVPPRIHSVRRAVTAGATLSLREYLARKDAKPKRSKRARQLHGGVFGGPNTLALAYNYPIPLYWNRANQLAHTGMSRANLFESAMQNISSMVDSRRAL